MHIIRLDACVTGCCFLPAGNVVICDRSFGKECIEIFPLNGNLLLKISIVLNVPVDVTCLDDKTVAV